MEHRVLGKSGLKVPVFSFGTATFGGGKGFEAWGATAVEEAKRLVDICFDAGCNFFDTADIYSKGAAEEILGQALAGRQSQAIISTKATFAMSDDPNAMGSSRYHLIRSCEQSLKRLKTDHIDIYHMHGFDAVTPIEETLRALDDLVSSGKVSYIACSNFSGWHLMKSLALSESKGLHRYVAHQAYYSLVGRELEWELMPLGKSEGVSTIVWSPLAGGALSGKIRRNQPAPVGSRLNSIDFIPYDLERLYKIVDVLDELAKELDKSVPQIVLNWTLQRPTVASIVIGARNEQQLLQNFAALDWQLSKEAVARLDAASEVTPIYPYWHQRWNPKLNPPLKP